MIKFLILLGITLILSVTCFPQSSEAGKFILYKYQLPMGAETYEITPEADSLVLKTNFELTFVGDKVPLASTLKLRKNDLSPLFFETKGKTSTRTEVDAGVEISGNTVAIRTGEQTKTQPVSGKFFTVAQPAPIAPQVMLFRYWKKNQVKGNLPLLPGGNAKIEFLGNDKITVGDKTETLERYTIEGVMW